jgi:putative ubiquitin-RnfH superfamily antitoxin RatB of RatAB toxin-antitoxin module
MSQDEKISVEVAYGTSNQQALETVLISAGVSCVDAIALSGISKKFPHDELASLPLAIWGKPATANSCPKAGDRIEILRPLVIDPRDARRFLAEVGQFMGGSGRDHDIDEGFKAD